MQRLAYLDFLYRPPQLPWSGAVELGNSTAHELTISVDPNDGDLDADAMALNGLTLIVNVWSARPHPTCTRIQIIGYTHPQELFERCRINKRDSELLTDIVVAAAAGEEGRRRGLIGLPLSGDAISCSSTGQGAIRIRAMEFGYNDAVDDVDDEDGDGEDDET